MGNDMYNKKVMDHFMNPRNVGEIEDADGVGEAGNPHGDRMKIFLKVRDNRIEDVKFKTFGCAAAIASSSMATEMIKGLPPGKLECSVVSREAIHRAINDYRKKQGLETLPEQD
jgi:nitrogen fixation NifU-like protein